jgi:rRNA maturation endonuclease Nob1
MATESILKCEICGINMSDEEHNYCDICGDCLE